MIVAVTYLFHDDHPKSFILSTDHLDNSHPFEKDVKLALEGYLGTQETIVLDGNKYFDNWGNLDKAKCEPPIRVDCVKVLKIDFEG